MGLTGEVNWWATPLGGCPRFLAFGDRGIDAISSILFMVRIPYMTRIPYMYGNVDIDNPGLAQVWIFRIWETS